MIGPRGIAQGLDGVIATLEITRSAWEIAETRRMTRTIPSCLTQGFGDDVNALSAMWQGCGENLEHYCLHPGPQALY